MDSNIIGIFIWDLKGRILEANEAFLRILGHARDISWRSAWTELTPGVARADDQRLAELKATGSAQPYEKEFPERRQPRARADRRRDFRRSRPGRRVRTRPHRAKAGGASGAQSERRHHEMQMEFAHVNRVTSSGS